MRDAASNIEVFEKLGRPSILPRDLLPDFSSHSSETRGGTALSLQQNDNEDDLSNTLYNTREKNDRVRTKNRFPLHTGKVAVSLQ